MFLRTPFASIDLLPSLDPLKISYPATRPDIWDDLCGKEIRHHKFPTEETHPDLQLSSQDGTKINILGVEFSNIEMPKYNDGTIIPNIAGYEILRGSREGNKSILAKGVLRNMREFDIPDNEEALGPKRGFYANYPYNDLRPDVYFHDGTGEVSGAPGWSPFGVDIQPRTDGCEDSFSQGIINFPPLSGYSKQLFTFHSPDLMFRRPFLNATELRVYGALSGTSEGYFIKSEKHPKNTLLRNGASIISLIVGIGYAIQAFIGKRDEGSGGASSRVQNQPIFLGYGSTNFVSGGVGFVDQAGSVGALAYNIGMPLAGYATVGLEIPLLLASGNPFLINEAYKGIGYALQGGASIPSMTPGDGARSLKKDDPSADVPQALKVFLGTVLFKSNIVFGAQKILDIMYKLSSEEDFAFKYNSHGFLFDYSKMIEGDIFRTEISQSTFLNNVNLAFNSDIQINNLNRPDTVSLYTVDPIQNSDIYSGVEDRSRYCVGGEITASGSPIDYGNVYLLRPEFIQTRGISMHYAASKFNFENQYGQLENIKQAVMQNCVFKVDTSLPGSYKYKTTSIFSGDTFVNRYTEKVIMPIFSEFLLGQPDQYPYSYLQSINIPYPRFWMNTRKYDISEFVEKIYSLGLMDAGDTMPGDLFYLDRGLGTCLDSIGDLFNNKKGNPIFSMRYGYMYTHVNGILDFFTETEINLANRDWEDRPDKRYYDPFRYSGVPDISSDIFHSEIIKSDNFYKYDYSLSPSRFITNLTSAGSIQPRDYDPLVAETCFVNYPKRLIYSLQAQAEICCKKKARKIFGESI